MKLYYRDIRIDMRGDSPAKAQKLAADYLIKKYITKDGREIQRGEHGKPFLPGNASLKFNMSHGGNYAVLAVSDKEIGVDIENLSRKADVDKIAKRVFTEAEREYVDDGPRIGCGDGATPSPHPVSQHGAGPMRGLQSRFFQIWTAKEAVMKATGLGFTLDPLSFSVVPFERLCEADGRLWEVSSNIYDGHMVSAAEEVE